MGTYYKYAERNADSQINWAEVGKDMSDMLKDEVKVREEKKAAIDAASREFGRVLSDPPQGEHTGASTFALKYADNASQFLKMQDQLLKSGQMKVKDYTISRQNLTDGTDVAFKLTKNYQQFYGEKMERYRTDKSQDLEQWLMGQSEIYSNFNKNDLWINPTDGTVSVAQKTLKNIDGKDVYVMDKNPNTFATVSTINNWITGKYDKFNTNAAADTFVGALGEELKATTTQIATLTKTGQITSIADITSRTDIDPDTKKILFKFIDAENQGIESVYANNFNRLSAVTNSVKFCSANGKQYTFTRDETDAKNNPEKILLKVDPSSNQPTPVFSDIQIKDSNDFMRNEFRRRYDYKEDIKTTPQLDIKERRAKTDAEFGNERVEASAKVLGQKIADLTTGTPEQVQSALDYADSIQGVKTKKTKDAITIYSTDVNGDPVENTYNLTKDGKLANPADVGKSLAKIYNVGGKIPEDIVGKYIDQFTSGKKVNIITEATGGKTVTVEQAPQKPIVIYSQYVDKALTPTAIPEKATEVQVKDALNKQLNDLGINVSSYLLTKNAIYLKNNDGKESPVFKLDDKKAALESIKKWIKSNPSKNLQNLIDTGVIPSGTGGATGAPAPNAQGVGNKYNTPGGG